MESRLQFKWLISGQNGGNILHYEIKTATDYDLAIAVIFGYKSKINP